MNLASHIKSSDQTYEAFAAEVGVSRSAVQKWVLGHRFPRAKQIARIKEITNGAVTADDFLLRPSDEKRAA